MVGTCPWSVVTWDIDDTLLLERDYVRSGFRALAAHLGELVDPEVTEAFLCSSFEQGVRGNTFDRLLDAFPELRGRTVDEMVYVYRNHQPTVRLTHSANSIITRLREEGVGLAALSDGPWDSQQRKADALGLGELLDLVILTDSWGREFWKPHSRGYVAVQQHFDVAPTQCVYVGDNPNKDFHAPNQIGWSSIRFRRPGQLHGDVETGPTPTFDVTGWDELRQVLSGPMKPAVQ